MAIAFIALLAALSGTAVALPGTNSVDSGDIKNGAVKSGDVKNNNLRSGDVRNNTLRGADVRNNSLTGADVNESTFGKVPSAGQADNATNATNATNANRANSAASVDRVSITGLVKANDGQTVTVLEQAGFRWELKCDVAVTGSTLQVVNVGAGDDAHFDDNLFGPQEDDFDQGETVEDFSVNGANNIENSNYSILAPSGHLLHGDTAVLFQATGTGSDCAAAVTGFGA
jgi:hypothetical protein